MSGVWTEEEIETAEEHARDGQTTDPMQFMMDMVLQGFPGKKSPEAEKLSHASVSNGIVMVEAWRITPAPENDTLYRPVDPADPKIIAMAKSISGQDGLLEPLVLSSDYYILSGHRRFAACRLAGLGVIPCRLDNVSRATERDRFVQLLRRYNDQRVKSIDEQFREALVDANPEDCRSELVDYRREKSKLSHASVLEIGFGKARCEITSAKFYLSCRKAAAVLGITEFKSVARWLQMLVVDGLLTEVEKGGPNTNRATRYRWNKGKA